MGFFIEYYLIVINIASVNLKPVQLGQQGNGIYYGVCFCVWWWITS